MNSPAFEGTIIRETGDLAAFCASLESVDHIAVDTEFIREKTYYPKLCLIQVAGPDSSAIIDPLSDVLDLAPLKELLVNPKVIKVFHAGKQDIEIFVHLFGEVPHPLFDTQIAAEFCGIGESISYSDLIDRLLNKHVDKGSRFTDWGHRPLSDRQLHYALNDVLFLHEAYELMVKDLKKLGRTDWAREEMDLITRAEDYQPNPAEAWKRLKLRSKKQRSLATLQLLAEWRENLAMEKDVPRSRILKDDALSEIAASMPTNDQQLSRIRGMRQLSGNDQKAVLEAVIEARDMPEDQLPKMPKRSREPRATNDCIQMLQLLLSVQCRENRLIPRLIATRNDLEAFATGQETKIHEGWRYEIFGKYAEALLKGELTLVYSPKKREVVFSQ